MKALTDRQRDVFQGIAESKTVREIALELKLSPKTVEYHRALAMNATGARDIAAITRLMFGIELADRGLYEI